MTTTTAPKPLVDPSLPLSVKAWKREVARRERAKAMDEVRAGAEAVRRRCLKFSEFVKAAWHIIEPGTPLKWNWHLDAMCDHLEAISRGQLKPRLIINVPPGSSKSTIVTVLWQAYEWGPLGKTHLRYVSTSFDLANVKRDTEKTLNVLRSEWYRSLWEVALVRQGVQSFSNTDMGTRQGVAFKSVTGKRGDRLVIDDPHSIDDAESENERDKATRRFVEGGLNRINDWETSVIVVVMQRLHEEDLTGVLLARDFGFIHLFIPMEFEPARRCTTPLQVDDGRGGRRNWADPRSYDGELMDPVRVPERAVENIKLSGEYSWAGQYQQRPAPREGGMFKVELIKTVPFCPAGGMTAAGWDLAGSTGKNAAYTVRVLMTRVGGDIYIRHVERRRGDPAAVERMIGEVSERDRDAIPSVIVSLPQDPGSAGKAVKWRISEILMGYNYRVTPETGDKETRALPFAAQVGAGRVFIVQGDWNAEFIEELRNFPMASLKDQVDASSRAFQELLGHIPAPENAAPELVNESTDTGGQVEFEGDPWDA